MTYQNVLASDIFVDSLPVVRVKISGLSPEKSLTPELSDFKENFFHPITVFPCSVWF
jgi:hypothetical protein